MHWTRRNRFARSLCALGWTSSPFWLNPGRRSQLEEKRVGNAPATLDESSSHGGVISVLACLEKLNSSDATQKLYTQPGSGMTAARQGGV